MINRPALRRAIIVGTVLQVGLALLGHFSGWIALHALLFLGMMISATSGYLYAQDVGRGYAAGAAGGAISGAVSALFGLAMSIILGDMDPGLFARDLAILALTGAVGGPFGQMAANLQPDRQTLDRATSARRRPPHRGP